jgi:APA family basic amino acid/polyamine antiporter
MSKTTAARESKPQQMLSVSAGASFIIGIVIGIGIFRTPSLVASGVGSEAMFIAAWVLGGAVMLVGALCYAELGSAHPDTGGEYHYLTRAFGRPIGVLFAWARGTVIQTGAIAAVAFVYADYASNIIPLGPYSSAIHAVIGVVLVTAINLVGSLQSARTQLILTSLTVVALVTVVVAGLATTGTAHPPVQAGSQWGTFGLAMVFVLLTYGGWNEVAYLSGEMRDVGRDIVRVLVIGTAIVTLIYVLINLTYVHVLGLHALKRSDAVGADLMRHTFGDSGVIVLSLVVCCCALSTLNGTIFTGARVYHALGEDLSLKAIGFWSERANSPRNALILQGSIAFALVIFGAITRGGFQAMIEYTAPVFWFFLLLVGISFFVLRFREPDRPRPFRVPLYPITPILFCLTCAYLLYSSLVYTGLGALVGVAVLLVGTPLLLISRNGTAPATD